MIIPILNTPINTRKNYPSFPQHVTPRFSPLRQDTFEKTQPPLTPSFTGTSCIPQKALKTLGISVKKALQTINKEEEIYLLGRSYIERVVEILTPKNKENPTVKVMRICKHEIINLVGGHLEMNTNHLLKEDLAEILGIKIPNYVAHQKNVIKSTVDKVDNAAAHFCKIEEWFNHPKRIVPFSEVERELRYTVEDSAQKVDIQFLKEFPKTLKVAAPLKIYDIISQAMLNALKYSEGKPIVIDLIKQKDGKYFVEILNKGTTPIPDAEIDKILQGTGYRAEATRDKILGTGTGFQEIIRTVKELGYQNDIPNLIEKGRKSGVKVRIPIKSSKN